MSNGAHGHSFREMTWETLQASEFVDPNNDPGKFGRMFKREALIIGDDALFALAEAMKDSQALGGDNPAIPAGYTYLGQFIDHDVTLDTTPLSDQMADPMAIKNFRSPALDLDSLYGDGPGVHPFLYARDPATLKMSQKFLVGKAAASQDQNGNVIPALPNDLPRNSHGRALIGDERNDENLLVAQTHLLFLKFHNKVVQMLIDNGSGLTGGDLFDEARRIVTWHYQWIVLFDYVERLTEPGLVRRIKNQGRRFYQFTKRPYMPAEFAAAAFRLGHSMVRQFYSHNRVFRPGGLAPGSLALLFAFTGKSGNIVGDLAPQPPTGPGGGIAALPSNWVVDWRRFYDMGTAPEPDFALNPSRKLDPFIVAQLHTLPGFAAGDREGSLAFRNLRRGVMLGLPSGQDVALAMGVTPLTPAQIDNGPDGAVAKLHDMHKKTPLWYYILKEAEVLHQGLRLGPVGSTIIAETFLGMVHGDHKSFLWLRANWQPELPGATPGHFTMADLINFVGDMNPIG